MLGASKKTSKNKARKNTSKMIKFVKEEMINVLPHKI